MTKEKPASLMGVKKFSVSQNKNCISVNLWEVVNGDDHGKLLLESNNHKGVTIIRQEIRKEFENKRFYCEDLMDVNIAMTTKK